MAKSSPAARQGALAAQLPVDPHQLASLLAHERAAVYAELELNPLHRAAAEEAVREVIAGRHGGAA
ncbi:MAG: hypothetical protein AABM66_02840 [Actinomycetota bacterium]